MPKPPAHPAEEYLGLAKQDALVKARAEAKSMRYYDNDEDHPFPVAWTADFRPQRLNLRIADGVVYEAHWG
jgi:hypothetical protein